VEGEQIAVQEKRGIGGDREGSGVIGMCTGGARERIHACGRNRPAAAGASAREEDAMGGARDEIFYFPIEAIIRDRFLETKGANVGGVSGEA
jgi:hypothetical protein